ncbi:MAG: hypothetical protein HC819_16895 [Cyclobacteriaceae bacterium]|nr:hypothetical protein [Cyclobacteriaceae bacterium]
MEVQFFESLNKNQQAEYVWAFGTILATRQTKKKHGHLFYVRDFFVEIIFNWEMNTIIGVKTDKSFRVATPYLKGIAFNLDTLQ